MRELTVKEFAQELEGKLVNVESLDVYGVSVRATRATIEYDEDAAVHMLTFVYGDQLNGGMSVSYEVDNCIERILYDEEDGSYQIQFNEYMSWLCIDIVRKITIVK